MDFNKTFTPVVQFSCLCTSVENVLSELNTFATPIDANVQLRIDDGLSKQLISLRINKVALCCSSNIAQAVGAVAKFYFKPGEAHLQQQRELFAT